MKSLRAQRDKHVSKRPSNMCLLIPLFNYLVDLETSLLKMDWIYTALE